MDQSPSWQSFSRRGSFGLRVRDYQTGSVHPIVHSRDSPTAYYLYHGDAHTPAAYYDHADGTLRFGPDLPVLLLVMRDPRLMLLYVDMVEAMVPEAGSGGNATRSSTDAAGVVVTGHHFQMPVASIREARSAPDPAAAVAVGGGTGSPVKKYCWLSGNCTPVSASPPAWELKYDPQWLPSPVILIAFAFMVGILVALPPLLPPSASYGR